MSTAVHPTWAGGGHCAWYVASSCSISACIRSYGSCDDGFDACTTISSSSSGRTSTIISPSNESPLWNQTAGDSPSGSSDVFGDHFGGWESDERVGDHVVVGYVGAYVVGSPLVVVVAGRSLSVADDGRFVTVGRFDACDGVIGSFVGSSVGSRVVGSSSSVCGIVRPVQVMLNFDSTVGSARGAVLVQRRMADADTIPRWESGFMILMGEREGGFGGRVCVCLFAVCPDVLFFYVRLSTQMYYSCEGISYIGPMSACRYRM
mmetsp:Transcript_16208/g.38850  ORF Transcript_16208/g.38850 Transcript_16208/m.38850 type:complete len:262 (+) Transcript_16208:2479-3264(+)